MPITHRHHSFEELISLNTPLSALLQNLLRLVKKRYFAALLNNYYNSIRMCDDLLLVPLDMFYTLQKGREKEIQYAHHRYRMFNRHFLSFSFFPIQYLAVFNGECSLRVSFRIIVKTIITDNTVGSTLIELKISNIKVNNIFDTYNCQKYKVL